MDSYIIQVQPQDELTVLIDKLMHTQAERVYLLVPDNSRIAHHVLNFRLLKREADSLGKEIVVVSSSPRVQNLALKAQLQAHQETSELKEGALKGDSKIPAKSPTLSDIVAPVSIEEDEEDLPKTKSKIKSKIKELKKVASSATRKKGRKPKVPIDMDEEVDGDIRDILEEENDRRITNFLEKRPSFKIPKISKRKMPGIPRINTNFNSAIVFKAALVSLMGVSLVILGITFYFILPKADIFIKPIIQAVSVDVRVTGDINISAISGGGSLGVLRVPAQMFEKSLEISKSVVSTGEKDVRDKATGTIKVHNSFSSSPQTLVKTTRFVSEGGKLFRTIKTVVVPGAEIIGGKIVPSFTLVEVVASEAGAEYNINPSTFSIPGFKGTPKYLAFYGESEGGMRGGEIGKVRVITRDDYKNLENEVRNELEAQIDKSLDILLPEGFFIPKGAKDASSVGFDSSANVGDKADELTITGRISTKAFALRQGDIKILLADRFKKLFPQKRLVGDEKEVAFNISAKNFEDGIFSMKIVLSQDAADFIDEEDIREGIRGKGESDVRVFLSNYPNINETRVTFWPFWVNKIPDDPSRVYITIE